MKVRLLLPAQYELEEAIEYYNAELPELGNAFLLEALAVIERIRQYPEGWQSALTQHSPLPLATLSLWNRLCPH